MAVIDDPHVKVDNSDLIEGLHIIDADTHLSEPPDLWTSRAPAGYEDRVPQLKERDGKTFWVLDGDAVIAGSSAASVVAADGEKQLGIRFLKMTVDDVRTRGAAALGRGYVSGHAAVVTLLVTLTWPYLSRNGRIVAVALAVAVCLARVYVGAHLPLDIVGGAALGLAVGGAVRLALGHPAR